MRSLLAAASGLALWASTCLATDPEFAQFIPAWVDETPLLQINESDPEMVKVMLQKRQNNCPANFQSCAGIQGAVSGTNACCQPNTNCQLDENRNVACCPNGQNCNQNNNIYNNNYPFGYNGLTTFVTNGILVTSAIGNNFNGWQTYTSNGIIVTVPNGYNGYNGYGYGGLTTITSNGIIITVPNGYNNYGGLVTYTSNGIIVTAQNGYNGFGGFSVTTYTSNGVVLTTTIPAAGPGPTTEASSITNSYFTYPALPTNFPNAAVCSAAYADCQTDYQKCTAQLGGGGNGALITLPGGQNIQVGATVTLGPTATSICSSLSQSACRGLALSNCNTYGVNGVNPNAAMPTMPPMVGVGVGVALGLANNYIR